MPGIKKLLNRTGLICTDWKRIVILLVVLTVAVNLSGIAIAVFVGVNLGSDTITVFIDGLHRLLGISYGSASRIYNAAVLIIALLIARKDIGWATVLYALSVGFAIDFYNGLLGSVSFLHGSLPVKFGCIFFAQVLFGITYALFIRFKIGMNQIDAITYAICRKTGVKYIYMRTVMDVILLGSGWLLGGIAGIGSVVSMLTTGLFVNASLYIFRPC
jgi:uncharacterized protein